MCNLNRLSLLQTEKKISQKRRIFPSQSATTACYLYTGINAAGQKALTIVINCINTERIYNADIYQIPHVQMNKQKEKHFVQVPICCI